MRGQSTLSRLTQPGFGSEDGKSLAPLTLEASLALGVNRLPAMALLVSQLVSSRREQRASSLILIVSRAFVQIDYAAYTCAGIWLKLKGEVCGMKSEQKLLTNRTVPVTWSKAPCRQRCMRSEPIALRAQQVVCVAYSNALGFGHLGAARTQRGLGPLLRPTRCGLWGIGA